MARALQPGLEVVNEPVFPVVHVDAGGDVCIAETERNPSVTALVFTIRRDLEANELSLLLRD